MKNKLLMNISEIQKLKKNFMVKEITFKLLIMKLKK